MASPCTRRADSSLGARGLVIETVKLGQETKQEPSLQEGLPLALFEQFEMFAVTEGGRDAALAHVQRHIVEPVSTAGEVQKRPTVPSKFTAYKGCMAEDGLAS